MADSNFGMSGSLTLVSAVIGIFVTLNTLLSTCSDQSIERAKAYREAVKIEEGYWGNLYTRYLDATQSETQDIQKTKGNLMSIALLSGRQAEDFSEFQKFSGNAQGAKAKTAHLGDMRETLRTALRKWAELHPDAGNDIITVLDNQETKRDRTSGSSTTGDTPPPVTAAQVLATESQQAIQGQSVLPEIITKETITPRIGSSVVTTGVVDGWDMDVFWCTGVDDALEGVTRENYATANKIGLALAAFGTDEGAANPNVPIGRVRVRSLSYAAQASGKYVSGGEYVVYDIRDAVEKKAAEQILKALQRDTSAKLKLGRSSGSTNWYMSIFVCNEEPSE